MQEKIYTVYQLTLAIKNLIEPRFSFVKVEGEITNLKKQSSGHYYFSLKDDQSQISAALFRSQADKLRSIPKEGDRVIATGEISIYAPRGSYQIIVRSLEQAGIGNLLKKLHELKEKLKAAGFFDEKRKKALPLFPKTIGVITSPTGSVIQDILHILGRRHSGFHLILNPVKVQGNGAAQEIAAAIETMNQHQLADVLIIGRGGGSLEDLWPFNEEVVAQAIYHSKIPIISAVGHETDFSISDFVADKRAPTPSAAAEICIQETASQLNFLQTSQKRLNHYLMHLLNRFKVRLESIQKQPVIRNPFLLLTTKMQNLDLLTQRFDENIKNFLYAQEKHLEQYSKYLKSLNPCHLLLRNQKELLRLQNQLDQKMAELLVQKKQQLQYLLQLLESINPLAILQKGYCIAFDEKSSSVIMQTTNLKESQRLRLQFYDGSAMTEVRETILGKINSKDPVNHE